MEFSLFLYLVSFFFFQSHAMMKKLAQKRKGGEKETNSLSLSPSLLATKALCRLFPSAIIHFPKTAAAHWKLLRKSGEKKSGVLLSVPFHCIFKTLLHYNRIKQSIKCQFFTASSAASAFLPLSLLALLLAFLSWLAGCLLLAFCLKLAIIIFIYEISPYFCLPFLATPASALYGRPARSH